MVIVVFRSRVKASADPEYGARADELHEIARGLPGFISFKDFGADDGERVSIHEWESEAHLKAWREHPRHREIQAMGRSTWYEESTLVVADVRRVVTFTEADGRQEHPARNRA